MKPHTRWSPVSSHQEAGPAPLLPVPADDGDPSVGRVEEVGDRRAEDGGRLRFIDHVNGRRMPPPRQHRGHEVLRIEQRNVAQRAEHLDAGRVETGLLLGFAQRGRDRVVVRRVDATTREGDLPGMRTQVDARASSSTSRSRDTARVRASWSLGSESSTPNSRSTAAGRASETAGRSMRGSLRPTAASSASAASCARALWVVDDTGIRSGYARPPSSLTSRC